MEKETIYENAEVKIQIERVDKFEGKLYVNGNLLIWISWPEKDILKAELSAVLDKFRI